MIRTVDPDPAAFLMWIHIQLKSYLTKSFQLLKKTKMIAQKLKATELVQIYLINYNYYQFPCIYSVIFQFFPSSGSRS